MAFKDQSYDSSDRHVSPSEIGRKLGLDEKTVRVRVNKMEGDGFIKYYQASPSLALFGLNCLNLYRFETLNIATKRRVIEHLESVPGVVALFDYLGPVVSMNMAGTSPEENRLIVEDVAKKFELSKIKLGERIFRAPLTRLDRLDWQIIQKLRYNARGSTKDIAEALSITPRLVEYRIARLIATNVLLIRAVIDTQKQQGLIFYELEMTSDQADYSLVLRELSETFKEKMWSSQKTVGGVLFINLFGFTLGEPEEAAMRALNQRGVRSCSLLIRKEEIEPRRPNWLDSLIEQKIGGS